VIESTGSTGEGVLRDEFLGVLLILVVALVVVGAMTLIHRRLGPKREFEEKLEPFECGESQIVSPSQRFSVKFYLVAMLFVLFDLEAVFFYPWGALFRELGTFGLVAMSVFTVPLILGLLYEWRKGALEW
jgi:NADH-quinone oxidoreductase subunit A